MALAAGRPIGLSAVRRAAPIRLLAEAAGSPPGQVAEARVGWRDATQVGYYGLGIESDEAARANYRFKQTYVEGGATFRPQRWTIVEGRVGYEDYQLEPGKGSAPSIETVYTPLTAPGLGESPAFVHTTMRAGIDTRFAPAYTRTGGYYGVELHNYLDTFSAFPSGDVSGARAGTGNCYDNNNVLVTAVGAHHGASWCTLILPYLDQGNLYNAFTFSEMFPETYKRANPNGTGQNWTVIETLASGVAAFRCPTFSGMPGWIPESRIAPTGTSIFPYQPIGEVLPHINNYFGCMGGGAPPTTTTSDSGTPRCSAQICASVVSCAWPWAETPT